MNRIEQGWRLLRFVWDHPEVRGHRACAMGRLIAWQCWERLARRPWTVELRANVRIRCYPHSTAAAGVIYVRYPEWRDMRFLIDFLRPGDLFVDVGANVGVYSLLACSIPDVAAWAFEPSTEAFRRIEENRRMNQLHDRLTVINAAAGSVNGEAHLTVGLDTVNRLEAVNTHVRVEPVRVVALDSAIPSAVRVDLIKVDVEGLETEVLKGARGLLDRDSPVLIIERNDPEQLEALLKPKDYMPYDYEPFTRTLVPLAWSTCTERANLLAIRDASKLAARLTPRP